VMSGILAIGCGGRQEVEVIEGDRVSGFLISYRGGSMVVTLPRVGEDRVSGFLRSYR
jgi:hypothetical protein